MKKPFNLRIPVLYAAALALGNLFAAVLIYSNADGLYILIPTAVFLAACSAVALVKKSFTKTLIFIIAVVFFVVGAVYLYLTYCSYVRPDVVCGELVKISGKVVDAGTTSGGSRYMIIDKVRIYGDKADGRMMAYITDNSGNYCRRGYRVTFYAVLQKESFIANGVINSKAVQRVRYFGTARSIVATYGFSLFGEINYRLESVLYSSLGNETAAVCNALLTGNTEGISEGTISAFRYGGIAHIFAVSGLHIGVVYGAISAIIKRTGLNRFVSSVLKIVIIILYAGVCGFSPSSVRAVTMCSVSSVASCLYRKYDGWNALSVAAIILLLINPVYMYSAGFVLSFSAVLGVVLLSRNFSNIFAFMPKKIKNALSAGLSAQFGTIPALMNTFGYVSAAGVFLNIIIIPVISVVYVILLVCALVSVIIPAAGQAILPLGCAPLELVANLVQAGGFENSIVSADLGYWFFVPFIFATVAVSDKFNFKVWARSVPFIISVAALITIALINVRPPHTTITFSSGNSGEAVLIKSGGGTVLVVTESFSGKVDCGYALDGVVVLGDEEALSQVFNIDAQFNCVYLRGSTVAVSPVGNVEVNYSDRFTLCGVSFEFCDNYLKMDVDGVVVSVISEKRGNEYGVMPDGSNVNFYCYADDGAVLFTDCGDNFGLTYCGKISYNFFGGKYTRITAVPEE